MSEATAPILRRSGRVRHSTFASEVDDSDDDGIALPQSKKSVKSAARRRAAAKKAKKQVNDEDIGGSEEAPPRKKAKAGEGLKLTKKFTKVHQERATDLILLFLDGAPAPVDRTALFELADAFKDKIDQSDELFRNVFSVAWSRNLFNAQRLVPVTNDKVRRPKVDRGGKKNKVNRGIDPAAVERREAHDAQIETEQQAAREKDQVIIDEGARLRGQANNLVEEASAQILPAKHDECRDLSTKISAVQCVLCGLRVLKQEGVAEALLLKTSLDAMKDKALIITEWPFMSPSLDFIFTEHQQGDDQENQTQAVKQSRPGRNDSSRLLRPDIATIKAKQHLINSARNLMQIGTTNELKRGKVTQVKPPFHREQSPDEPPEVTEEDAMEALEVIINFQKQQRRAALETEEGAKDFDVVVVYGKCCGSEMAKCDFAYGDSVNTATWRFVSDIIDAFHTEEETVIDSRSVQVRQRSAGDRVFFVDQEDAGFVASDSGSDEGPTATTPKGPIWSDSDSDDGRPGFIASDSGSDEGPTATTPKGPIWSDSESDDDGLGFIASDSGSDEGSTATTPKGPICSDSDSDDDGLGFIASESGGDGSPATTRKGPIEWPESGSD
jgi:hypothetical protein